MRAEALPLVINLASVGLADLPRVGGKNASLGGCAWSADSRRPRRHIRIS